MLNKVLGVLKIGVPIGGVLWYLNDPTRRQNLQLLCRRPFDLLRQVTSLDDLPSEFHNGDAELTAGHFSLPDPMQDPAGMEKSR